MNPDIDRELTRLRDSLVGDGWCIDYGAVGDRAPGAMKIVLAHELSARQSFSVPEEREIGAVVTAILASAEIAAVHSRPAQMEHSILLGRLRVIALAHQLSRKALADIGSVLRSVELISEAEEDWLAAVGGAWSEPGPPDA